MDAMAESLPVQFETKRGSPMLLEITAADGKKYELAVALVVMGITQDPTAENPTQPGMPLFQVQVQMAFQTKSL